MLLLLLLLLKEGSYGGQLLTVSALTRAPV